MKAPKATRKATPFRRPVASLAPAGEKREWVPTLAGSLRPGDTVAYVGRVESVTEDGEWLAIKNVTGDVTLRRRGESVLAFVRTS